MSDVELPSWTAVQDEIAGLALGVTPAELHGALSGWFAGGGADAPDWLAQVMADPTLPDVPQGAMPGMPTGYTPPGTKVAVGASRPADKAKAKDKRKAEKAARKKSRKK